MKLHTNTQLWLNALRSGECKKRNGNLGGINANGELSFCALGVACELYRKSHSTFHRYKVKNDSGDLIFAYGAEKDKTFLPHRVFKWLKLKNDNSESRIAAENDSTSVSFNILAGLLEDDSKYFFLTK